MKNKFNSINEFIQKGHYGREILVVTFIVVLTLVGFLIYNSLAIFQGTVEKKGVAKIVAGPITFDITSSNNSYDSGTKRITVSKGSEIELPLTITNKTPIAAKYKLYYKPISPSTLPDGTVIAVLSSTEENYDTGVLEKDATEEKTVVIRNQSTSDITIELGVDGGYSYNPLDLAEGHNQLGYEAPPPPPNPPQIDGTGLIPVVYNETDDVWQVANTEEQWYDYGSQWWANAVTVSDTSYRTKPAGTEIPMDVINSMWVWIPRYKYKITGNIGSTNDVTNPPQIEVIFENGADTTGKSLEECPVTATNCYYTHPAFRNSNTQTLLTSTQVSKGSHTGWDKELTGIWVGKFETGTDDATCNSNESSANCNKVLNPIIKPDVPSLRNQTVSNQFKTSLKFAGGTMAADGTVTFDGSDTYGLSSTTDTHMMKNTEWGAVAYLSQSQYGKNGNDNYKDADKEIYKNDSSSYYTGRSSGQPPKSEYTSNGTYSYNGKSCDTINSTTKECIGAKDILKGTGASTTGTIYGIYDMSGGAYDRTMGNWAETTKSDGFTKFPEQKYWDKYTGSSSYSITSENVIKGDATYETMKWYSDYAIFVLSNSPWFNRGGKCSVTSIAGVFSSSNINGVTGSDYSFRSVLIP